MVEVKFTYDETIRRWETTVTGCTDRKEAMQALNAVTLTLRDVVVGMEHLVTTIGGGFLIEPAVTLEGLLRSGVAKSKPSTPDECVVWGGGFLACIDNPVICQHCGAHEKNHSYRGYRGRK